MKIKSKRYILNKFLSNIYFFTLIPISVLSSSVTASYLTGEWLWFGRSGAIVTMAGVILSLRPMLRVGFNKWVELHHEFDAGTLIETPEEIEEKRQVKLDVIASYTGAFLTIIGTLIWGYGDLLDKIF